MPDDSQLERWVVCRGTTEERNKTTGYRPSFLRHWLLAYKSKIEGSFPSEFRSCLPESHSPWCATVIMVPDLQEAWNSNVHIG